MKFLPAVAAAAVLLAGCVPGTAVAGEPWYITGRVVVHEPMEVGDVLVLDGGELLVEDVGEPGFVVEGNLWAVGTGRIVLRQSVISIMATFHGQYSTAAANGGHVEVAECTYRVPNRVHHGLVAFGGTMELHDTEFDFVQFVSGSGGRVVAERLDGNFEVILLEPSSVELRDIPRKAGGGAVWVWPTFPEGSEAVHTPPLPGFVERWDFPPPGSTGISQTVVIERCEVLLWPMLVEAGSRLTLKDIPEDNWVVVGLYLPGDTRIRGLINGGPPVDRELDLADRTLLLVNAAVDTWNLYPTGHAMLRVEDSVVGEILVMENSSLVLERSTVDGSGGYFGVLEDGRAVILDSTFTCDVQVSERSWAELHRCRLLPYPQDPDGSSTRLGAYGDGRILLDTTEVLSTPALGERGLLAVAWIENPPAHPPGPGASVDLHGVAALYSLDPVVAGGHWRLEAWPHWARTPVILGSGWENVDPVGLLGTWSGADPHRDHELRLVLTDGLGRVLSGSVAVPGAEPPAPRVLGPSVRLRAGASAR